eukprot:CAMPEP_0176421702 /NCGR_PEP_ID=MMETSP0127-20121128/9327_1 /TAXON_ID=938130 /ORGANISM="Platyophrya macrostoma, Strain WH" /LENGTH=771 /DNA_ID=CAMNT_0017802475 /DNA_START=67 /DNA_END=2382 /DNA_ORIENTATION=-
MPFSKAWRAAMYPDFKVQGAYIDYKELKEILHRLKEDIANPSTPDELYAVLVQRKEVVYQWCVKKVTELTKVSEALVESSEHLDDDDSAVIVGESVEQPDGTSARSVLPAVNAKIAADAILFELLRFVEVRNLNNDTIEHIIGRMYRYSTLGPTGKWRAIHSTHDFFAISIDEIFYLLSVVYERVKKNQEEKTKKSTAHPTGAVGSQVFDRRSIKYLVHREDLPFVIARIIQHLPVSMMKDVYKESKETGNPFTLSQRISSVYFDNRNFLFYHRRLERLEGSSLIRIRWYTDSLEPNWERIDPDTNVYMEMKVHHEAWSGERSTKRRFAIKERDVDAFLRGNLSLEPAVAKLRAKQASEKEVEKFKSLAEEILSKVQSYDLKPVLRTQCARAAFQRGQDQSVRVSIDTQVHVTAEDFGMSHHWRYEGNDPPGRSDMAYAIVEVKLQCAENERIAPWIEELMNCRYMEGVPKFSKYGHGVAMLYGHTPHIKMVPYWVHQMDTDIRASLKPENSAWDPTLGIAVGCFERTADRLIFGSGHAQTQTVGASQAKFLPGEDYHSVYNQLIRGIGLPKPLGSLKGPVSVDLRHDAYTAFHLYPFTSGGVESVCFGAAATGRNNAAAHVFSGFIPWQTGKRIRVPQKYDPKTLVTSERYMVKWVEKAAKLGLIGVAIIHFGYSRDLPLSTPTTWTLWRSELHVFLGVALVIASLLTMVYAYFTFKARSRRVYARRKIRFDDVKGPSFLTFLMFGAVLIAALNRITLRYGPMLSGDESF